MPLIAKVQVHATTLKPWGSYATLKASELVALDFCLKNDLLYEISLKLFYFKV